MTLPFSTSVPFLFTVTNQSTREPEFFYGPGTLLYKNAVDMAIHPTCFNSFPWFVVRQNVANSGLDSLNDWDQVMKMCMDWYR